MEWVEAEGLKLLGKNTVMHPDRLWHTIIQRQLFSKVHRYREVCPCVCDVCVCMSELQVVRMMYMFGSVWACFNVLSIFVQVRWRGKLRLGKRRLTGLVYKPSLKQAKKHVCLSARYLVHHRRPHGYHQGLLH